MATDELGDHVGQETPHRKPAGHGKAQRDGRVEVATGDMSHGVGHGQDGQAERQRHAEKADADLGKGSGEDGRAATTEHQPERAEALGRQSLLHETKLRTEASRHDGPAVRSKKDKSE